MQKISYFTPKNQLEEKPNVINLKEVRLQLQNEFQLLENSYFEKLDIINEEEKMVFCLIVDKIKVFVKDAKYFKQLGFYQTGKRSSFPLPYGKVKAEDFNIVFDHAISSLISSLQLGTKNLSMPPIVGATLPSYLKLIRNLNPLDDSTMQPPPPHIESLDINRFLYSYLKSLRLLSRQEIRLKKENLFHRLSEFIEVLDSHKTELSERIKILKTSSSIHETDQFLDGKTYSKEQRQFYVQSSQFIQKFVTELILQVKQLAEGYKDGKTIN